MEFDSLHDGLPNAREVAREHLQLLDQGDIKQELCPSLIKNPEENYQPRFNDNIGCSSNKVYSSAKNCPTVPSQVTHWLPLAYCKNSSIHGNLSSIPSLISHYVRLPNPGKVFSSLEHLEYEFKELLKGRRHQDCRQM